VYKPETIKMSRNYQIPFCFILIDVQLRLPATRAQTKTSRQWLFNRKKKFKRV